MQEKGGRDSHRIVKKQGKTFPKEAQTTVPLDRTVVAWLSSSFCSLCIGEKTSQMKMK